MCGQCRNEMAPNRKRTTTRRRKPAKRQRRMTHGKWVLSLQVSLLVWAKQPMGSPKPWGIINANKLRKSVYDACDKWKKAKTKNMPVNRLIPVSCEGNH